MSRCGAPLLSERFSQPAGRWCRHRCNSNIFKCCSLRLKQRQQPIALPAGLVRFVLWARVSQWHRLSAASRLENCPLVFVCVLFLHVSIAADLARASARSVAASYKPSMLVTRVRLPACALGSCNVRLFCLVSWPRSRAGRHIEVSPGALWVHNRRFIAGLSKRHVGHVHLPIHAWLCVRVCLQ